MARGILGCADRLAAKDAWNWTGVLASTAQPAEALTDGEALSKGVVAAEEQLQGVSFYEPGYENAVKGVQLARARQRAREARTASR